MEDIRDLYILGQPIDTNIGKIHFLTVKEYTEFTKYIPYLEAEKFEVIDYIKKLDKSVGKTLEDASFLEIIHGLKNALELYSMFKGLFQLCFKNDVFDLIGSDEEFEHYRDLIRKMNGVQHEVKNPNPEIQYFNDLKKKYDKKKSNGNISFESIYTSVWLQSGINPNELTVYQLYALFSRITQFKNYDTTVLYNSVSGEVPIEAWYKHVDILNSDDKNGDTTFEDFSREATEKLR